VAEALGLISIAASPAVLSRVVMDTRASGPVTERALALTTLSTLYALANSLGRPMSWLLAEQVGAQVGGPGIATRLLDVTVLDGVTVEVYAIRLDAGCRHESDAHGPTVVEHLLVVGGRAAAGVVGAEQVLATGMSTSWVSDRRHAYQALGDAPADVVLVIRWGTAPPGGHRAEIVGDPQP
jgi:quercetin dioxygenase-like cupin family protein